MNLPAFLLGCTLQPSACCDCWKHDQAAAGTLHCCVVASFQVSFRGGLWAVGAGPREAGEMRSVSYIGNDGVTWNMLLRCYCAQPW